jgi:hypothetical protein
MQSEGFSTVEEDATRNYNGTSKDLIISEPPMIMNKTVVYITTLDFMHAF